VQKVFSALGVLFYPHNLAPVTRALSFALLAVVAVLAWQTVTVRVNYQGNWTGLFRIGSETKLPDTVAQGAFRNPDPHGYDGQYYLILAHDPLLRHGAASYFDAPLLRARRILVPAAAWALAAGRPGFIVGAYVFVILAFIFAGTYWLSLIFMFQGRHPAWGLCFLMVPPVLIAVDSMTIDVAIAALAAGFAWQLITGRVSALWLILAAAGLVRETGLLLIAACVIASLYQRDWRKTVLWASASLPALCWYGYLHFALAGIEAHLVPSWMIQNMKLGILLRVFHPLPYPQFSALIRTALRILDELALAAIISAAAMAIARLRYVRPLAQKIALVLFVLLIFSITARGFWSSAYGFSRPFAPLWVLLLAGDRPRTALMLSLLVDLRVSVEFQSQALRIFEWFVGR
jgi:hypothetical protein